MKYFTVFFSFIIFISLSSLSIFGQEPPKLEQEEAPATVWDMNIGDTDVDLYMTGYWKIGIMGGLSVESGVNGIVFPAAFPGLTEFLFYQEPDMTISLWLMNRFYLETSFLEGFDKNTYAIGYRGMEGEVLQSVRIGNSEISIDDYKGINVPAPKYNTPGISASFQTEKSYHDVLFRYDPTSEQKKVFLGEYEIAEEIIETDGYTRGQYFILPDDDIDFIEVYIADKNGIYSGDDGKKYNRASENEVYYSLVDGTVSLFEATISDVLVYYEKSGNGVGHVSLGAAFIPTLINGEPDPSDTLNKFDWVTTDQWYSALGTYDVSSSVTVNTRKSLKIYNPKKFGPFEYFNKYKISSSLPPDLWRTEIFLADNSLIKSDDSDSYEYQLNIDDKILSIYNSTNTDIRSPWSRYPLADSYPILYGSEETDRGLTGRSILLSIKNQNGLNLGSGVVPGSEQIFINGYETSSAVVDYGTGQISFSRFIFPQDRIVVLYRTETTDLSGGDLLFAQGNRFYPSDFLELHLAEMFRWNISKKSSSSVDSTSPGGLIIAGGLKYEKENLYIELTSNLSLQTPDTTGYLRLQGMESSGYSFSIGEDLVKEAPASVWDGFVFLTSGNRSYLNYYDYYSTNGLGQYFLNSYNWAGATLDPSKNGPSIASKVSGDPFDSNVMVMEYDVALEWSVGDLLFSTDGPIDLSRFTSVSMRFKKIDPENDDLDLLLFIGENGELDDWDNDGFVESSDTSLIVKIDVPDSYISANDEWNTFTHYFTPSQMEKLTKSRSLRVLIDDSTVSASGKLLIADVQFEGSIFDKKIFDEDATPDKEIIYNDHLSDILNITEIEDPEGYLLAEDFTEIKDIFHPSGETQKLLKIEWDLSSVLANDGDYWIIETNTSPVPGDTYKEFSFYIKNDPEAGTYDISLTDSQNRGYTFTYSPTSTNWEKLTLSLDTDSVTNSSGTELTPATRSSTFGELTKFAIKGTGTTSGTMYLDELHFSEPTFSLDGSVELITDYSYPGQIISTASGFPILSDFSISNQFRYSGGSVLSSVSEGVSSLQNNTSLGLDLLILSIEANMKINWNKTATDLSGSHSLKFPANFTYGYISDSYSRSGSDDSVAMVRENILNVNVPNAGNFIFTVNSNGSGDVLLQGWKGETLWTIASVLKIGGSLNFEQFSQWDKRDTDNYFSNWIDDYKLIIPLEDSVNVRAVKSNLDISLDTKPVGFTLNPYLSFETEDSPLQQQINRGGFIFTLPITLIDKNDDTWSIIPSYQRSFLEKTKRLTTKSFAQGFDNLFYDLDKWLPLTSFIPFYELFASETTDTFNSRTSAFDEANYSPDFGVSISRKFGSHIYDLFLPYNLNFHFIRSFGKKEDTLFNNNRFEFSFKQTAINLFGSFGVYETFSFYNTDEFTSSFQLNLSADANAIPEPVDLIYQNYLSFYGQNNSVLIFENRFDMDFQNTVLSNLLDFKFIWQRPMREKFNLNFLNNLIDKEHFWSHEESLGLKFQHPWENNELVEYTSININVKHLSKLNVPGMGALRTWLKLGFYGDQELIRAGFEAGLEIEVSF